MVYLICKKGSGKPCPVNQIIISLIICVLLACSIRTRINRYAMDRLNHDSLLTMFVRVTDNLSFTGYPAANARQHRRYQQGRNYPVNGAYPPAAGRSDDAYYANTGRRYDGHIPNADYGSYDPDMYYANDFDYVYDYYNSGSSLHDVSETKLFQVLRDIQNFINEAQTKKGRVAIGRILEFGKNFKLVPYSTTDDNNDSDKTVETPGQEASVNHSPIVTSDPSSTSTSTTLKPGSDVIKPVPQKRATRDYAEPLFEDHQYDDYDFFDIESIRQNFDTFIVDAAKTKSGRDAILRMWSKMEQFNDHSKGQNGPGKRTLPRKGKISNKNKFDNSRGRGKHRPVKPKNVGLGGSGRRRLNWKRPYPEPRNRVSQTGYQRRSSYYQSRFKRDLRNMTDLDPRERQILIGKVNHLHKAISSELMSRGITLISPLNENIIDHAANIAPKLTIKRQATIAHIPAMYVPRYQEEETDLFHPETDESKVAEEGGSEDDYTDQVGYYDSPVHPQSHVDSDIDGKVPQQEESEDAVDEMEHGESGEDNDEMEHGEPSEDSDDDEMEHGEPGEMDHGENSEDNDEMEHGEPGEMDHGEPSEDNDDVEHGEPSEDNDDVEHGEPGEDNDDVEQGEPGEDNDDVEHGEPSEDNVDAAIDHDDDIDDNNQETAEELSIDPTDNETSSTDPTSQKALSTLSGGNTNVSTPTTVHEKFSTIPADHGEFSTTPGSHKEFSRTPGSHEVFSTTPGSHEELSTTPGSHEGSSTTVGSNEAFSSTPGSHEEFSTTPAGQEELSTVYSGEVKAESKLPQNTTNGPFAEVTNITEHANETDTSSRNIANSTPSSGSHIHRRTRQVKRSAIDKNEVHNNLPVNEKNQNFDSDNSSSSGNFDKYKNEPEKEDYGTTENEPEGTCQQTRQYTEDKQAYWVMNNLHILYLNGLNKGSDGEDTLLPITGTSGDINTKYSIEIRLDRVVTVKGIFLGKESKIHAAWIQVKLRNEDGWKSIVDSNGTIKVFPVNDDYITFDEPHDMTRFRLYPVKLNGIVRFHMPGIIECMASEWGHVD